MRSQPSYDTSWQREHEDFGTSEDDDYDYGDHQDGGEVIDDEEESHEPEPGSAIVVAEEGRVVLLVAELGDDDGLAQPRQGADQVELSLWPCDEGTVLVLVLDAQISSDM